MSVSVSYPYLCPYLGFIASITDKTHEMQRHREVETDRDTERDREIETDRDADQD